MLLLLTRILPVQGQFYTPPSKTESDMRACSAVHSAMKSDSFKTNRSVQTLRFKERFFESVGCPSETPTRHADTRKVFLFFVMHRSLLLIIDITVE